MSTTVGDVMTRRVIALHEDAQYKYIATVLRRYRVSACPVIDEDGRVIGVVSEADMLYKQTDPPMPPGLHRLDWRLHEHTKATAMTAGELMTTPAVVILPTVPVATAAKVMQDRQLKRLPVVDADECLIGIVTRSDVLSVFERSDEEIWDEVVKVMVDEEFALDPASLKITVRSGVVTLGGQIDQRGTALKLLGRVRHTEGVVGVRDRLSYPAEPYPD
jgi:CBS domain-containing protein